MIQNKFDQETHTLWSLSLEIKKIILVGYFFLYCKNRWQSVKKE
ncbi:MAG: hypothetical protein ACD_37C00440G0002 [uncultured bacterium]|nr:MAG: hypothetical protein ACD_37C00440G0002 [uncultured bacterium]